MEDFYKKIVTFSENLNFENQSESQNSAFEMVCNLDWFIDKNMIGESNFWTWKKIHWLISSDFFLTNWQINFCGLPRTQLRLWHRPIYYYGLGGHGGLRLPSHTTHRDKQSGEGKVI